MKARATLLIVLSLACSDDDESAETVEETAPALRYTLRVEGDWMHGALEATSLPAGSHALVAKGRDAVVLDDIEAHGATLTSESTREATRVELRVEAGSTVRVTWRAQPVEDGKHGRVGFLTEDFAVLVGGMLLVPEAELSRERRGFRGEARIDDVRVEVNAPEGWTVESTLRARQGSFDPAVDGRWRFHQLKHASFALGRFQSVQQDIGDFTHRIVVPATWNAAKRNEVAAKVWRIHSAYEAQMPCAGLPRYTTIFVPTRPDGGKVAGELWSTGQLFSFDAYPEDPRRPFELVAHRIAHTVNKYEVCGMHLDDAKERWFTEGWASWSETSHLIAAGVTGNEARLELLGNRYRTVRFGLDVRSPDVPVWFESRPGREPTIEYLHYIKAPLVVSMLDHELRSRSGGTKHINDFLHRVFPRHRGHARPLRLFEELERYLGQPLDDFKARYVEGRGSLYPMYQGSLAFLSRQQSRPRVAAIEEAGAQMSEAQVSSLRAFFGRSSLVEPAEVDEKLREMVRTHAAYIGSEHSEIPQEMIGFAAVLPGSVRYQLFLDQKQAVAPE